MIDTRRSPRPGSIIQADIAVTRLGLHACSAVVEALLAARYGLLQEGWPTTHPMCEEFDKDAARWAAHREQQRRALADLLHEAG